MKKDLPTIIGVLFLIAGLIAGVFLTKYKQQVVINASVEETPKNVRIVNITDSSFSVIWTTNKKNNGFVNYGESISTKNVSIEKSTDLSYTHLVEVTNLKPITTYYFKINSGGIIFDNNGIEWSTLTGKKLPQPTSNIISGKIVDQNEMGVGSTLVITNMGNSFPLATLTSSGGNWSINLSLFRNSSLDSFSKIDNKNSLIEISVRSTPSETSTAKIFPASSKPVPEIKLGNVYDFRSVVPQVGSFLPNADLKLPTISTDESSLN